MRRGRDVANAGHGIETALIMVADSLSYVVGREGLETVVAEQAAEFEGVRRAFPSDDST
jgi:hypothetical protein